MSNWACPILSSQLPSTFLAVLYNRLVYCLHEKCLMQQMQVVLMSFVSIGMIDAHAVGVFHLVLT